MGDLEYQKSVVSEVQLDRESSTGNEYSRVVFQSGLKVDFYSDSWKEELRENQDEYEGLVVEVFYEDRGYTFGKAIVPASSKKAGELLEKKIPDDFDDLTEEEKEDLVDKVEKIYERENGDQEGLDSYAS